MEFKIRKSKKLGQKGEYRAGRFFGRIYSYNPDGTLLKTSELVSYLPSLFIRKDVASLTKMALGGRTDPYLQVQTWL